MPDDALPTRSDTPPDHVVIGLRLDPDTLPGWYDRIMEIAPDWVRRIAVIEHPEGWYLKVEVHRDRADGFREALSAAWAAWNAGAEE